MKALYQNMTSPLSFSETVVLGNTPHLHKELEIVYVKEGCVTVCLENQNLKMASKDILIVFPNQVHSYNNANGSFIIMNFSNDVLYGIQEHIYNQIPRNNVFHIKKNSEAYKVMNYLQHLDTPYQSTAVSGCINILISIVLPQLELRPISHSVNNNVKNILDYCLNNYTSNITLEVLANELHISKYHISHLFNKTLQISFNNYINNLRIAKACHALVNTDKKIADIAEDVGFGSIRSFNSAFKNFMNCTPRDYRTFKKD